MHARLAAAEATTVSDRETIQGLLASAAAMEQVSAAAREEMAQLREDLYYAWAARCPQ